MSPRLLSLLCALMLLSPASHAESNLVSQARNHFEAGRALYNLGNYADAAREFSAGYELVHRPQFLINLGQCYRKMNQPEKAREMYEQFLKQAPPNDPARTQVTQVLREMEPKAETASPPSVVTAPPASVSPDVTTTSAPIEIAAQKPAKKSGIARYWWIIPVAAVAAAGIGIGIYFAARPAGQVDCNSASLGCVSPGLLGAGP